MDSGSVVTWVAFFLALIVGSTVGNGLSSAYLARRKEKRRVRMLESMRQEEAQARIDNPDVPGQCNARWSTNRCNRPAGHDGLHGHDVGRGLILAPWGSNLRRYG